MILDSSLIPKFAELCKFDLDAQKFSLLYRASRDGFGAVDFHSKCDSHANTVTIIQTSKGFILGGYTQASWMPTAKDFKSDSNAFLFSLVNPLNKQFVCKIIQPADAIECKANKGPCFGSGDICVLDKSNESKENTVALRTYQAPTGLTDPNDVYFCDSTYFQVNDIEVFKILPLME